MPSTLRAMTIEDLWALKLISAGSISPDGQWICASVTSFNLEKNNSTTQLFLFSRDGKMKKQLTKGNNDSDPQWSPDGKSIAFVSKRVQGDSVDEAGQLYLIAIDGGEAARVGYLSTGVAALRWFPDSKRIACVSWVWPELRSPAAQEKRLKQEKDDKVKAIIVENNHYRYWDHWFARGRKPHIHTVDIRTGGYQDLFSDSPFHLPPQEPDASHFDISPDGNQIAFAFDFNPDPREYSCTDIVAMDFKTRLTRRMTKRTKKHLRCSFDRPRYSPDGQLIALLGTNFGLQHNEQNRLWLLEVQTESLKEWTGKWDRSVNGPVLWAPNNDAVYFSAESGLAQPIWRLALKDELPTEISRGPAYGGVASDLRLSADGNTLAFTRSSMEHPPTVYALDIATQREVQIEKLNDRILKKLKIHQAESVQIKGFGKDSVQMWVVKPQGYMQSRTKKWPLMQVIHGGPHTCWNDTWHWRWNMQLFAAQGYVVCAVNYHGSSGFGQKYLSSINGDWGRRELADVEAGTDYMLATERIDKNRMVATGGSYGGYMVAYMNGNLPRGRYAAYVCHAGCYDWVSMMGSDGYFWFGHELGAFHWDDEQRVLKQSPHHYANKFSTPTLVMHGELDYRVPYYQGLAYYNTLRARNIPSRLVFFPDENHWILKPQNSKLWYREFIDWCNHYTQARRFAG